MIEGEYDIIGCARRKIETHEVSMESVQNTGGVVVNHCPVYNK